MEIGKAIRLLQALDKRLNDEDIDVIFVGIDNTQGHEGTFREGINDVLYNVDSNKIELRT